MGVFFVPTVWGAEIDKPCQYDDTTQSIKCGDSNTASGERSSALGVANTASGKYSSALGVANTASGNYSSAMGFINTASGEQSAAFGFNNQALSNNSLAIGSYNNYSEDDVVEMGTGALAVGFSNNYESSGKEVKVGQNSAAVGRLNFTSGRNSVAFGNQNQALSDSSIALGLMNNQSASAETMGTNSVAVGNSNNTIAGEEVKVGAYSAAVGISNVASGNRSSAFGHHNTTSDEMSSAFGYVNTASGDGSSAFGYGNTASNYASSAFGRKNTASGYNSSAFGINNETLNHHSSAFGAHNTVKVDFGTAIGFGSLANRDKEIKGLYIPTNFDELDAKGKAVWQSTSAALAVGNPDNTELKYYDLDTKSMITIDTPITRQITGVAAGSEDTDAVNVAQLKEVAGMVGSGGSFIPFTVSGTTGNFTVGSSGSLKMVGSNANLSTNANGNTVTFALNNDLTLTSVSTGGVKLSANGLNNGGKQIKNVANGSANTDAANVGQMNTAINNAQKATFKAVKGGDNITATPTDNGVTLDLNKDITLTSVTADKVSVGSLTVNKDGKISGVANGVADTDAVNVAQLKELDKKIGAGGFEPITVSGNSGSLKVDSKGSLKMVGSNTNITTTASGDTVTFALADNLNLTSVTTGGVKLSANGLNNGGKVISNVAAGSKDTDAVNVKQLNDAVANAGKTTLKAVKGGSNITATPTDSNVTLDLNKNIDIESVTTGNVKLSAKGLNNGGNVISNVAAGSKDTDAVNVKQLKDANAANLKASVQAVKGDNKNITTQAGDKEVQVALNDDISLNSVTAADKITVGSLTVNKDGKITGVVSDINDDSTAVNVGLLKEELKKGGNYRPITVAGDTGSFEVDNGGKAIWAGDSKNITTAANGDTVKIELNKNIEVDSVTAGSTVVNNNGVKVGNNGVALTQNGLNNGGQVISNVAAGVRPTDAVNVAQLNNAMGGVYGRIDSVEKHANAGIAQALAAANMPTASQPGEGMLSISGGVYRGEQGYAIGYSQLSENGRWVIRATGSGNSRNHFGGAVGVGFKLF